MMMTPQPPFDLRTKAKDRYRVEHDEATQHEPGGRRDPWQYQIPCRNGHIYPHSATHLALWWESTHRLDQKCQHLSLYMDGDFEKIYLFQPEHFEKIARLTGARRRRRLSEEQRKANSDRLSRYRFCKTSARQQTESSRDTSISVMNRS